MSPSGPALIIGGTGQDGSLMARQLLDAGLDVHVTGRHIGAGTDAVAWRTLGIWDQLVSHRLDPLDAMAVHQLITEVKPAMIFCLTGQSSVGRSFVVPGETMRSHVDPVINVCSAVHGLKLDCHILVAASGEVFGETPSDSPASEESPFAPRNPYGVAKVLAVEAARSFRDSFGLRLSIAYLYNHESRLRDQAFLFGKILLGIAQRHDGTDRAVTLGSGDLYRDWGWAPDYVAAMIKMASLDKGHELILATGKSVRLRDAASAVVAAAGLDPEKFLIWNNIGLQRPGEALTMAANPAKAGDVIGWTGSVSFPDLAHLLIHSGYDMSCR